MPTVEFDIAATPARRARPPDAERSAVGVGPLAGRPGTHAGRVAAAADRAEAGGEPAADPGRRRRWPGEERARRHHQAGHEQGAERGLDEPDDDVEGGRGAPRGSTLAGTLFRYSCSCASRLACARDFAIRGLVMTLCAPSSTNPRPAGERAGHVLRQPADPAQPFLRQVSGRLISQPFDVEAAGDRVRDLAVQRVQPPAAEVVAGYPSNSSPVLMFGYSAMLFW
jgi:hypothetical protein